MRAAILLLLAGFLAYCVAYAAHEVRGFNTGWSKKEKRHFDFVKLLPTFELV